LRVETADENFEGRMDPVGRLIGGGSRHIHGLDARARARTGVLYSEGWSIGIDDSPALFALDFVVRTMLIAVFLGLAAGYRLAEEKQLAWMLLSVGR
jgi:hypothetical protein